MDITPVFNKCLKKHDARPVEPYIFRVQDIDTFLQEAYRINACISELTTYLRRIRPAYLSTIQKHSHVRRNNASTSENTRVLTDRQRTEIDNHTKASLRGLDAALSNLSAIERRHQQNEIAIAQKQYGSRGFSALSRWAAGGKETAKSNEERADEQRRETQRLHRESVLWYLTERLGKAGELQREMMEVRLQREVEKSKSVLYKAKNVGALSGDYGPLPDGRPQEGGKWSSSGRYEGRLDAVTMEAEARRSAGNEELPPELRQMFEQEEKDMLKYYDQTLTQVRQAESSLNEIMELQGQLLMNLATQTEQIEQLVQDADYTAENVTSGNKELKRATERKSTARAIFWGTCVFCATLVIWDLLI